MCLDRTKFENIQVNRVRNTCEWSIFLAEMTHFFHFIRFWAIFLSWTWIRCVLTLFDQNHREDTEESEKCHLFACKHESFGLAKYVRPDDIKLQASSNSTSNFGFEKKLVKIVERSEWSEKCVIATLTRMRWQNEQSKTPKWHILPIKKPHTHTHTHLTPKHQLGSSLPLSRSYSCLCSQLHQQRFALGTNFSKLNPIGRSFIVLLV
jgi:hypothetical protein